MSALIRMLVVGPLADQFQHIQNKVQAELVWIDKDKHRFPRGDYHAIVVCTAWIAHDLITLIKQQIPFTPIILVPERGTSSVVKAINAFTDKNNQSGAPTNCAGTLQG